jgi:protoporphyrinogen/coproporphyrinogen III oxidase
MNKEVRINVAIAGAGLTGLTTAFYLKKAGIDFQVFEKADRAGGVIQTHHENGFMYEAGPNSGMMSRPEVAELLEELSDYLNPEPADETAKSRWIWYKNKWVALPSGVVSGITTPLFTFPDKLRLLAEPFRKKGNNPNESLAELVLRRMGRSFLNYAIDPFILGIYSGDPAQLVTKYAFPKLYWLEQDYGSFIGGSVKKAREPKSERDKKATKSIFSVKGGLSNLIIALVKSIGVENIGFNCTGLCFEKTKEGFKTSYSDNTFTHVVSTAGAYEIDKLFPFLVQDELIPVSRMEYSKVVQVSLGFKEWTGIPLRAFGGLVPSIEKRRILGILFLSSFLKERAPEGGALLSVFLGGTRNPGMIDLSDSEIRQTVKEELQEMLQLKTFSPDLFKIFRYTHAIPQYGFESEERVDAIQNLEKKYPGLILAGNIRDGIGIADRINQGRMVASEIINSPL